MGEERSQQLEENVLSSLEIDTIGEILNISMGSAATAISTMLDRQVVISTPTVEVKKFNAMDYAALEPAMSVKIHYVEGISGSNVMIFRQKDMQVILNLLMGNDEEPSDDFVFDELSMSAACEVMNQMMGASATALSEFLGRPINISTPEASVVDEGHSYNDTMNTDEGEEIVAVSFHLTIAEVMDSGFASIMSCQLAKDIVNQVMGQQEEAIENIQPVVSEPVQEAPAAPQTPAPATAMPQQPMQQAPQQMPQQPQQPMPQGYPPMMQPDAMGMSAPYQDPQGQQPQYPPYPPYYGYPGYPPMPYAPYPQMPYGMPMDNQHSSVLKQPDVNIQQTQFPQFTLQNTTNPSVNSNMDMLMDVSLDVSVEIGKAKRKIKEIIEFGQGTVIELSKQAGAPVDIVVNGRLLARGDVVVIDDNFGVRITEILGTKELMDSLKDEAL